MTEIEAYRLLGVQVGVSVTDLAQAYKETLTKCQLELMPGQPLSMRQNAQQKIVKIQEAWQLLQNKPNRASFDVSSTPAPQSYVFDPIYSGWFGNLINRPRLAGCILSLILMTLIIIFCVKGEGNSQNVSARKSQIVNVGPSKPAFLINSQMAQLRVFSIPWCYVEIDGIVVGTSGQLGPFEISSGIHKVRCRHSNIILSKTMQFSKGQQQVLRVQFEKGTINAN